MSALRPSVLYVGQPPMRLVHALAEGGFDVNIVDEAEIQAGMTGGELLLLDGGGEVGSGSERSCST